MTRTKSSHRRRKPDETFFLAGRRGRRIDRNTGECYCDPRYTGEERCQYRSKFVGLGADIKEAITNLPHQEALEVRGGGCAPNNDMIACMKYIQTPGWWDSEFSYFLSVIFFKSVGDHLSKESQGASTDSNVFIVVYGSNGDTGKRMLEGPNVSIGYEVFLRLCIGFRLQHMSDDIFVVFVGTNPNLARVQVSINPDHFQSISGSEFRSGHRGGS